MTPLLSTFLAFCLGAYCGAAAYCEYKRWREKRNRIDGVVREFRDLDFAEQRRAWRNQ